MSKAKVHDLRVEVRRLRTILWVFRSESRNADFLRKLDRDLRKLNHYLGKVREVDVAIDDSKSFNFNTRHLKRMRDKRRQALKKYLERRKGKLLRHLEASADCRLTTRSMQDGVGKLIGELSSMRNGCSTKAKMHKLRIRIKRARYLMEAFDEDTGSLRELQSLLGRVHDLELLRDLAGGNSKLDHDLVVYRAKANSMSRSAFRPTVTKLGNLLN